jgi:hypothetical protein
MSTKDGVERLRRWWWFWEGEKAEKREPCRLRRLGSQLDTGMGEGSRLGPGAESLTHATTNAHGHKQAAEKPSVLPREVLEQKVVV